MRGTKERGDIGWRIGEKEGWNEGEIFQEKIQGYGKVESIMAMIRSRQRREGEAGEG